jgi:hypothetical protein
LTEQIRNISKARLGRKIGEVSLEAMKLVENAVKLALGMENPIEDLLYTEEMILNVQKAG